MSLPLTYRPEARDDIDTAYLWYEQQRPGRGDDFLAALRELLDQIQQNPELYGVTYRRTRAAPTRQFPFVVYYRVDSDRIIVIAVQHGKRNPRHWRGRI
jgi:plasmid stabilization system protein ParE